MHRIRTYSLGAGTIIILLLPSTLFAGLFDNVPVIGPIVKEAEKIPVIGPVIKKVDDVAGDAATGIKRGAEQGFKGVGQVLGGLGKLITGDGNGWKDVQEGFKTAVNGTVLIATTGVVTVLAAADPIVGTLFFGTPSPLQGIAKFIYETINKWRGKPSCNPGKELERLMTIPKKTLGDGDRFAGALSTPFKYLSSIFDGIGAWEMTGCDAVGYGKPIRDAQHSTDGFWTADLKIVYFEVQGQKSPPTPERYIRLEIIPGTPAHESATNRLLRPSDVVQFSGPMMWDRDKDNEHPGGHMEVHPYSELKFGEPTPPPPPATTKLPAVSNTAPPVPTPAAGPTKYVVKKGDNLSKLAERLYGVQQWPWIYCPNRALIRNPDLIYPGQEFELPSPETAPTTGQCLARRK